MNETSDRPTLSEVTLVAASSVALQATVDAIRASVQQVDFGEVLLFSDIRPDRLEAPISWRRIGRLESRLDYSTFMLRDLARYIKTSHALCIQWDGFVIRGCAWQPMFLEYDYIGAPWPHFRDGHNVGNGGFSLRSRRLLEACQTLPLNTGHLEDVMVSRLFRPRLEMSNMRFAPEAVAKLFSYERMEPTGREFGFHGAFNLARHVGNRNAAQTLIGLERGLLARNERWELLRSALAHGNIQLAANMARRLV